MVITTIQLELIFVLGAAIQTYFVQNFKSFGGPTRFYPRVKITIFTGVRHALMERGFTTYG